MQNTVLDLSRRALYSSLLEILIIIFFTKPVIEKQQSAFDDFYYRNAPADI